MQTSTRAPLTEHVPVPSANTNIQRRQAGKYCLFFSSPVGIYENEETIISSELHFKLCITSCFGSVFTLRELLMLHHIYLE